MSLSVFRVPPVPPPLLPALFFFRVLHSTLVFLSRKIEHTTVDDQLSSAKLPLFPSSLASAVVSFCLRVVSICQVMPSPNGSGHVLSSCGEENDAKEHLERGHCIDEANVHDDNSLDRRNGRMRFSDFHGFLRLLPLPVFSFPQGCSLRSRSIEGSMRDQEGNSSEASKPVEEESPNAIPKLKSALKKSPDDENGSIDSITKADNAINKKYCQVEAKKNESSQSTSSTTKGVDISLQMMILLMKCSDIVIFGKISSVVQTSPRAVCILSVVGAVAIIDMCPAGYFGKERTSRVAPNGRSKRRRVSTNQTVINSDVYMNLEVSSGSMESKLLKFLGFMWNPLSWVMESAAIMAIALANGGYNIQW
ncbi:hypothetical protein RHGRI_017746 [Rhododendron griersonianum]|uniref:Uncharacterized protein n=1 Tax=Rhododendron griersonianum TaxID=479676 RepID=A0AAV6JYX3_9ERIC|nr:hypothetical protein RHGRI_017746 [Rhododendron griersonianum]